MGNAEIAENMSRCLIQAALAGSVFHGEGMSTGYIIDVQT